MGGSRNDPYTPTRSAPPASGGDQGRGGAGDDGDPCLRLSFAATLSSPSPAVVGLVVTRELLSVRIATVDGVRLVEVRTADGRLAGTLMTNLPELLACLERGFEYLAEVRSLLGGAVSVFVRSGRAPTCAEVGFTVVIRTDTPALVSAGDALELRRGDGHVEAWSAAGEHVGNLTAEFPLLSPCLIGGLTLAAVVSTASDSEVVVEVRARA